MIHPFTQFNPVRVIFGRGQLKQLPEELKGLGRRVLWMYGKDSIRKSGLYDRIQKMLQGFEVVELSDVSGNPQLSKAREGIDKARKFKAEAILAVGGGSVIDTAKVIAFGACTDEDAWSFFLSGRRPEKALPILALPTMAASASEVNAGVTVSNDEGTKLGISGYALFPKVAILDSELLDGLSPTQLRLGMIDAFSHACEYYFNGATADGKSLPEDMAEVVLIRLRQLIANLGQEPIGAGLRDEALSLAASAHNGLLAVGRGRVVFDIHVTAHSVGGLLNLYHPASIAVTLPAWFECRTQGKLAALVRFGNNVFGLQGLREDSEAPRIVAAAVRQMLVRAGAEVKLGQKVSNEKVRKTLVERILFTAEHDRAAGWTPEVAARMLSLME